MYHDALRLARGSQYGAAIQKLLRARESDPSYARIYGKLLAFYGKLGRGEDAKLFFEQLAADPHNAAYGHYALGLFYSQRGSVADAESQFRKCIEIAPGYAPAYTQLIATFIRAGQADRSVPYFQALERADRDNPAVQYALGFSYQQQDKWDLALKHLDKAGQLASPTWEVLYTRYLVFYESDRLEQADAVLDEMVRKAEQTGNLEWKGYALGCRGTVQSDRADYKHAVDSLLEAIAITRDLGDRENEHAFEGALGLAYFYIAKYREALIESTRASELARDLGNLSSQSRDLGIIASIHAEIAEYLPAIQTYQQAIAVAHKCGDRASEADQLASLALVYTALGNHREALNYLRTAIAMARAIGNPWLEGRFLEAIGQVYRNLDMYPTALKAFDHGLLLARKIGDRLGEATRLGYSAEVLAPMNTPAALNRLARAVAISHDAGAAPVEGRMLNQLAALNVRLGKSSRALTEYQSALEIGETTRVPEVTWEAQAGLARLFEQRRQFERARELYLHAIEGIEQVRAGLSVSEEKAGFLENKIEVYNDLLGLLYAMNRSNPDAGNYRTEAFQISERARARAVYDLLSESSQKIESGLDRDLLRQQNEVNGRISRLQIQLREVYSEKTRDTAKIANLSNALDDAEDNERDLRRKIRAKNQRYGDFQTPEPLDLRQAQLLLDNDAVLLEYSIGRRASYLLAVTRTDYLFARLPPSPALVPRIRRLREAIAAEPTRAALSNYWLDSQALYRDLIQPAARLLAGKKQLIIAADGALHYLPFAALLRPQGTAPGSIEPSKLPYLVRDFAISYVPSASVLAALQQHRSDPDSRPKAFLAYADPQYRNTQHNGTALARRRGILLDALSIGNLRRLPQTRREVQAISRLYRPGEADTILDDRATEEDVKTRQLDRYRIIHFATHGVLSEARPQFSGLALTLPGVGSTEDGLLQVYEIFNLKLNADLVVLSACETALGKQVKGEGLVGLVQAFLYAGARSVAVSLWDVEDRATADLMIRFYHYLQNPNISRAEALRRAQLDLIGTPGLAHPYNWSAFILAGDVTASTRL